MSPYKLIIHGHYAATKRLGGINTIKQTGIVGRDAYGQLLAATGKGFMLAIGKHEDPGESFDIGYAVAQLPLPVIPFSYRDVRIESL
jgi:hypothetical protein